MNSWNCSDAGSGVSREERERERWREKVGHLESSSGALTPQGPLNLKEDGALDHRAAPFLACCCLLHSPRADLGTTSCWSSGLLAPSWHPVGEGPSHHRRRETQSICSPGGGGASLCPEAAVFHLPQPPPCSGQQEFPSWFFKWTN